MWQLHYNLLDKARKEALAKLKAFQQEAILAGGTALFLQIAHRLSFDFDLFLGREIENNDLRKLRQLFELKEIKRNTSEQLDIITGNNVLITLVYYPYKFLFKTVPTVSLPFSSIKDIALDKAFTIGRRAVWRDYVDLFFLLKKDYINLSDILKLAEKKFNVEFNPRLFLEQLIYFEDLEITPISFIKEKYSSKDIQKFLKQQVKKLEI